MTLRIRPPRPDAGERLRKIALAAKAQWGYEHEAVAQWAAEGDFSPEGLRAKEFFVAEVDGTAVAFGRHLRDSRPSEWGRILPVMGIDL